MHRPKARTSARSWLLGQLKLDKEGLSSHRGLSLEAPFKAVKSGHVTKCEAWKTNREALLHLHLKNQALSILRKCLAPATA